MRYFKALIEWWKFWIKDKQEVVIKKKKFKLRKVLSKPAATELIVKIKMKLKMSFIDCIKYAIISKYSPEFKNVMKDLKKIIK